MSFIGELTQGVTNTLKDSVLPTVNGWLEELQSGGAQGEDKLDFLGKFGNVTIQ